MRKTPKLPVLIALLTVALTRFSLAEDWKGEASSKQLSMSAMAGVGVVDGMAGPGLVATFAKKIVHKGFAPEINNQVHLEGAFGPTFIRGETPLLYSAHLRWDFQKDLNWTLYAVGGLGGVILPSAMGGGVELFPRFGIGIYLYLRDEISLRAELSHEFSGAGVSFHL
ncbi:MAG: hypothetical protein AB7F43_08170 [Bacteriovoracia bacterium]